MHNSGSRTGQVLVHGSGGRMLDLATRLVTRGTDEFDFWLSRSRWLRSIDQFIVVGTGAVDDMAARPWSAPYDLFRWCRAAHSAGIKVVFLSVGAGPVMNRVSRALMLAALRAADYRSYRDVASMEYLRNVGFDTAGDCVYPDLVFSLPEKAWQPPQISSAQPLAVGLGVIGYYGWRHDQSSGEPIYQDYLAKLKRFLCWLLDQGYIVRILHGDVGADQRPVDELLDFARTERPADWQDRLFAEGIANMGDLFQQIAQCDIVVANRFHNIVCTLMMGRPVVSIGYHWKNDALMAEMGLGDYCQHIEHFSVDRLIQQFQSLVADKDEVAQRIQHQCTQYRQMLDEQYRRILCPEAA